MKLSTRVRLKYTKKKNISLNHMIIKIINKVIEALKGIKKKLRDCVKES